MKNFILHFLVVSACCLTGMRSYCQYDYPEFPKAPIIDTIFEVVVTDNYREFENYRTNNAVKEYYNDQDKLTENYFSKLSVAKQYTRYLNKIDRNENAIMEEVIVSDIGSYFYLKMPKSAYERRIYYKESIDSPEVLLFNPAKYRGTKGKGYYISSFQPSWDGTKVAISLERSGDFTSEIIVLNVKDGSIRNTGILNSRPGEYYGMNWIPNTNSFTYSAVKTTDMTDPDIKLNTHLKKYDLDKGSSETIFGNGVGPTINPKLFPVTRIHNSSDKYLVVYVGGPSTFWDSYYVPFNQLKQPSIQWSELFKIKDKTRYATGKQVEDNFFAIQTDTEGVSQIIETNLLERDEIQVVHKTGVDHVITDFEFLGSNLFIATNKYGAQANLYRINEGYEYEIPLPQKTTSIDISKSFEDKNLWLDIKSPLTHVRRYLMTRNGEFKEEVLYKKSHFPEFEGITYKLVEVPSHDGVKVPMTIIYHEEILLDGTNAVFAFSDGAYGRNNDLSLQTQFLSFVSLGGVLVYPHIRGGGAKGPKWHEAGQKQNKPNSWKDLKACIDYLVENKYTTNNRIALYGESGGALPPAMCVNKSPDIVGSLILKAPSLNPARKETVYNSSSFVEHGSLNNKQEAIAMLAFDPYLNIPEKADFPATLVYAGIKDDRIYLHEPLKYITQMQLSNTGKNPILLDVDYQGSHNEFRDWYEYYGRILSFALENSGVKPKFD